MIDISVKELVKSYDVDVNLLDGLSFEINEGERVAILGRNGAGKTTLFRILTGEIDVYKRQIQEGRVHGSNLHAEILSKFRDSLKMCIRDSFPPEPLRPPSQPGNLRPLLHPRRD